MNSKKISLKKGRAGPSIGRHPWVFAGAIANVESGIKDGDIVAVHATENDRFIGYGLYYSKSQIRVRLYSWDSQQNLDSPFWEKRISNALDLRENRLDFQNKSARLIFSESDLLSGLTVDRLGEILIVQFTSAALFTRQMEMIEILRRRLQPKAIYLKTSQEMSESSSLVGGEIPPQILVEEEGLRFLVNIENSQKTGFYLDQRETRIRMRKFAQEKKRALDLCCYTGGFALHLAQSGAAEVTGVDSSKPAIEMAEKNKALNSIGSNLNFIAADTFDFLKNTNQNYDLIVLDPPRLAPSRADKERALRMYFSMNEAALKKLNPGGIFLSCSCSGSISSHDFASLLQGVGRRLGRDIQILEKRGASSDHPILAACPETEYLKAFVCLVR